MVQGVCLIISVAFSNVLWILAFAKNDGENDFCLVSDPKCNAKSITFGKILEGYVLAILPSISLEDCIQECGRRQRCKSINFFRNFPVCELNYRRGSNEELAVDKGGLFTEKSSWQEKLLYRKCNPSNCGRKQACVGSASGNKCEISDCGMPPSMKCAIADTSQGISIYSKVTYRCKDGFQLEGKSAITCQKTGIWSPRRFSCKRIKPFDCNEVKKRGNNTSGAYVIYPICEPVNVYCKMEGKLGWTVITARVDAHENFNKSWNQYKNGFGLNNVSGSYWIGNKNIHALTWNRSVELKFEVTDTKNDHLHIFRYANFSVSSNDTGYQMKFAMYETDEEKGNGTSTAYHSLCPKPKFCHNNTKFSTYDNENDRDNQNHCAVKFGGGWWYNACHGVCLTGHYKNLIGYRWEKINGEDDHNGYLKSSYMMIRPYE